jgi:hypothetical protein
MYTERSDRDWWNLVIMDSSLGRMCRNRTRLPARGVSVETGILVTELLSG